MLLGDNSSKRDDNRNLLLAMVLMFAFLVAWTWFFPPPPPPAPAETPISAESPRDTPPRDEAPVSTPAPGFVPSSVDAVAALPEVAQAEAAEDDEVVLRDEHLELVFTRVGARLKRATVLLGENGKDSVQLVPEAPDTPDADALYPLGLRFQEDFLGDELDRRRWDAVPSEDGRSVTFRLALPEVAEITKTYHFTEEPHVLDMVVGYTNHETAPRRLGLDASEPAFSLYWGPYVESTDHDHMMIKPQLVWHGAEGNERLWLTDLVNDDGSAYQQRVRDTDWTALKSAYFVVAMKPEFEDGLSWVRGTPEAFRFGIGAPRVEVPAGETASSEIRLYLGPNKGEWLAAAWPGLDSALEFFTMFKIMDTFAKLLLGILNWFYANILANYGFAIIFLTIIVRMCVFPLTFKGMTSMKKMQKLQPEMQKIKEECGDDAQELQKRMMEMYRERGVNPLGGCFPLLLQMPVFIALYRMLASAFELRHAPFIGWIDDLSAPDALYKLPAGIPLPFMGEIDSLNVLPFLMAIAMVLSMKYSPSAATAEINPQQKVMMRIMPVFFSLICYNMSAGLNLYILTSTLLGVAQNYAVHFIDMDVDVEKKKKTPANVKRGKPRNFYAAAQQRKREMAKEARRNKKSGAGGNGSPKNRMAKSDRGNPPKENR